MIKMLLGSLENIYKNLAPFPLEMPGIKWHNYPELILSLFNKIKLIVQIAN